MLEQFGVARGLTHLHRVAGPREVDLEDILDLARPRDAVRVRETPSYAELFQHIWHSLGEEFVRGRRP